MGTEWEGGRTAEGGQVGRGIGMGILGHADCSKDLGFFSE